MNIYPLKNGQYAGPYSEAEIMTRIKDGRYAKTDLAWREGMAEPMPIVEILCQVSSGGAADGTFSADELRQIAQNYKNLFGVAVCWFVFLFIPMSDSLERICILTIGGLWIRFGWQLSGSLRRKRWPWVIWSLIPLGNIYALVRILCTAARTLKANGIPCGITGADPVALARLPQNSAR